MKKTNYLKLAFCMGLSFLGLNAKAQTQEWSLTGGSFFMQMDQGYPSDYSIVNGTDYYIQDSIGYLRVFKHLETGDFKKMLPSLNTTFSQGSKLQMDVIGSKIIVTEQTLSGMKTYVYDVSNNTLSTITFPYNFVGLQNNWETKVAGNKLFLTTISSSTNVSLMEFDASSNSWISTNNLTSILNITSLDISNPAIKLAMYTSATDIYVGVSGPAGFIRTLGKATLTNISGFSFYNSAGSNDGNIYYAGAVTNGGSFFLTGDGIDSPRIAYYDPASLETYEVPVGNTNVNIMTVTDPSLPVNIGYEDYDVVSIPNFGTAVLAKISNPLVIDFNRIAVIVRDDATNTWDSVFTSIPFFATQGNSLSLSVDANRNHFYVKSDQTPTMTSLRVLNKKVEIDVPSITLNSGNCVNTLNQFYSNITVRDYDGDKISPSAAATFPSLPDKHFQLISADSTSIPTVYHFALYGTPTSIASYMINTSFLDKFTSNFAVCPPVNVTAPGAAIVSFTNTTNVFCDNIVDVDLASLVNPYNLGVFSVNGDELPGTIMHIPDYIASGDINGTLNYRTFVNGCLGDATATYTIPTTGTITINTTVSTCGASDGTASMTFTPGTSPMSSFEWSTGENATSISNLTSGTYYCEVIDNLGCKKREYFDVDPNGISITGVPTNVDCFGNNSGSVDLTITGITPSSILWSNGQTTEDATNLVAGTYSVVVSNAAGCQITRSFDITEPQSLMIFTTPVEPACGSNTGQVMGNVSGGVLPYTYNWSNGQTTAILTNVPSGSYTLLVTDANGCMIEKTQDLDNQGAPIITGTIHNTDCNSNNGAIGIIAEADPVTLLFPGGYLWSNGDQTTNPLGLQANDYTVEVKSGPNGGGFFCYAYKTFTVGINGPQIQDICVVTVDTATTTNFVVWEKADTAGVISHYNIYRETANSGQFLLIDTVNYSNLSQYNDLVASATDGSWRYRISSVNTCGVEGPQSPTHKTLVLNGYGSTTPGDFNVYWDDYEGTASVSEYVVWRHTNTTGWQALSPTVPIGVSVFTDNLPVDTVGLDYFVETVLSAPCTAEKINDFNSSRSNRQNGLKANGNSNGIKGNAIDNSTVYPNPFENKLMIELSKANETKVEVLDITGKLIYTSTIFASSEVELVGLNKGMYFVRLSSEGKSKVLQVVKN